MTISKTAASRGTAVSRRSPLKKMARCWQLYLILLLPLLYLLIFCYYPMFGVQIAFKDFTVSQGIWGSPWVGLKHFEKFIQSPQFFRVMKNTILISFYSLLASTPVPILLALCVTYIRNTFFKKSVQMITYMPYFISTVVLVGMINQLFSTRTGVFNTLLQMIGFGPVDILSPPQNFIHIYVWSGVWQMAGFNAIIYIAALSSVDPALYEACTIDGGNKFQQIWYVDLPSILPTVIIMLIMNCGSVLNIGFEKVFLMQNPSNLEYSEVISTLVYKVGLKSTIPMYSYSSAVGLFTSVISLILLTLVNAISRRVSETSLW